MSETKFKEYPTDEDYNKDYWEDFLKRKKGFKAELKGLVDQAAAEKNAVWLRNQQTLLVASSLSLMNWAESNRDKIPKWQIRETKEIIKMRDWVIKYADRVLLRMENL
jgi:hypothetical protein